MKRTVTVSLACFLAAASLAMGAEREPSLKVKGLYIGMDITNVATVVKETFPKDWGKQGPHKVSERPGAYLFSTLGQYYFWIGGELLPDGVIIADKNKKVTIVQFSTLLVNELFKAEEMEASDFVKMFAKGYKIPEFKTKDDWSGWYYANPDGYKVTIADNKGIILEKTATAKEAQGAFD